MASPTATQRFDPANQRLRSRKRMKAMDLEEIEMWMAHGVMLDASLQRADRMYECWTGGARPMRYKRSLRLWCITTMASLEAIRNRKFKAAMMIPPLE